MYRLYRYGNGARGVFRGDVLVCESIPEARRKAALRGLPDLQRSWLEQALADHNNYWAWRRERNDARWQQQEAR